jgi:hypothetical protein
MHSHALPLKINSKHTLSKIQDILVSKFIRFQTPEVNKHRLPQRVTLTEGNFVAVERTISNDWQWIKK